MGLTGKQLEELKQAISRRREAMEAEVREDAGRSREDVYSKVASAVTDSGDAAQADVIADTHNAELLRDVDELRELEAAQARVVRGSYGLCVDCGGEIPFDRLRAEPAARRCLDCQRRHEKAFVHRGTPSL